VSPILPKPIADSLEITFYLSKFYPPLLPASHEEQMATLLKDLHGLNYFSLSFPGRPNVAQSFKEAVEKRLAGNISETYREALKFKIDM
jgi:hypothetical protein